jgi:hypothetical protein
MIKLIAAYSKKIGLPGFSSHSFSVPMETELNDVENVASESERLYATLQESVDSQIQNTGYVPPAEYGMNGSQQNSGGTNGRNGGQTRHSHNGDAGISEPQLDLINKIVREKNLNKAEVENMAVQMFGNGVRALNRMQASQLIDELFEKHGRKGNGNRGRYQHRERVSSS